MLSCILDTDVIVLLCIVHRQVLFVHSWRMFPSSFEKVLLHICRKLVLIVTSYSGILCLLPVAWKSTSIVLVEDH